MIPGMATYLVDFFSKGGELYRRDRVTADSDFAAEGKAIRLAVSAMPAAYKITRLEKAGNIVVQATAGNGRG